MFQRIQEKRKCLNRLIGKGAEANLYLARLFDRDVVVKERIRKSYRVDSLDQNIRSYRTIHEAKMIHEAKRAGVSAPVIYLVDEDECKIFMEYLLGPRLKETLAVVSAKRRSSICRLVGDSIGRLHRNQLIHGDLTTSNMILSDDDRISFIDFGLSFQSSQAEDRGVDIHLMRRALNSTHFAYAEPCFRSIMDGYEEAVGPELAKTVLSRAKEIERRGRYFAERQA
jgi:TP53 regulating kinase-like protein